MTATLHSLDLHRKAKIIREAKDAMLLGLHDPLNLMAAVSAWRQSVEPRVPADLIELPCDTEPK